MAVTFKEQQERLIRCRYQLSVWKMLFEHLDSNFTPKEGTSVKGIKADDCPDLVPLEVIEEILESIEKGPIEQLNTTIEAIENQEVVVIEKGQGNGKRKQGKKQATGKGP